MRSQGDNEHSEKSERNPRVGGKRLGKRLNEKRGESDVFRGGNSTNHALVMPAR